MYLNKVQLIGNLTRDPELKALPSGINVASFSIATNETFKDASGAKKEKVEFHNIIVFGKTAENVAQYMKKGSQIYIEGKLQTRSWDGQDGKKNYRTEVVAMTVQFGSKPQGSSAPTQSKPAPQASADPLVDYVEGTTDDINPEDIPF